ncbi:hypothetical protein KO529_04820 [Arenibacter algicola]|uniref:DUF6259 domain-containing protein n=1 Tax=Arenibacter algicola TaxID=616991 RepID=UPI001C075513|nr:DUF6259 domain-containing protein [Arenibacter algicola]MBU2904098.1 hypothetical protein [Arenibacter algicola]
MRIGIYINILILIGVLCTTTYNLYASSQVHELKTTNATLSIDQQGNLKIFETKSKTIIVNSSIYDLWKVTIKNSETGVENELIPDESVQVKIIEGVIHLVKNNFSIDNNQLPINVDFTISVKNDAFSFSGSLKSSHKDFVIKELAYPNLAGLKTGNKDCAIYWPVGQGQRYKSATEFGSKTLNYPGSKGGAMPWFSINSDESAIYVGGHDSEFKMKDINLSYSSVDETYMTSWLFPINTTQYTVPDVVVKPYKGNWYEAAKFYRAWYDRNFNLATVSNWTKEVSGLMLTILKQQNGKVMWEYKDMNELCDIAEKRNIDLIGLWGWGVGGHDRLYPDYMPDNLLGGVQDVKKAIEVAQKRGFKVIVYSNGTLIDSSTDYYLNNGIETIKLEETKRGPKVETYLKYSNTTPVIHVQACYGSSLWRKTMLDLALNAQSLGVDAFYIDQVAVRSASMCYSTHHDHKLPQEADAQYKVKMMSDIRNKLKEIDPEFSIITEGISDHLLGDVDVFHSLSLHSQPNGFPELLRYTFPEVKVLNVNSSPALSRTVANYDALYGFMHEIMIRYMPDVEYLKSGAIPSKESYTSNHVNYYPQINTMTEDSAEETASYAHDLIKFQKDNASFLKEGKFIDEDGIKFSGKDILAKGFLSENKVGVIVWNQNIENTNKFSVEVPGYRFVKATAPRNLKVKLSSPLESNSIRLLIYEKN